MTLKIVCVDIISECSRCCFYMAVKQFLAKFGGNYCHASKVSVFQSINPKYNVKSNGISPAALKTSKLNALPTQDYT